MRIELQHAELAERLRREVVAAATAGQLLELSKDTSNLFRRRTHAGGRRLDARHLNRVLRIDARGQWAEVEGLLTYEDFVEATLQQQMVPAVVPQLKTITVGGAVSGLGIESASHRYGLVHETVEWMEVLSGNGTILNCSRSNDAALFHGIPNSYGSLGLLLALRVYLIQAKQFVHLRHTRFRQFDALLAKAFASSATWVDATAFSSGEMYLSEAHMVDEVPRTSDYTYKRIYYHSIPQLDEDWMTIRQYLWRWDTDWFWCSRKFGLENPILRTVAKPWLNSRSYQRWMPLAQRWLPDRGGTESVIQDVQIPRSAAERFLEFLWREVRIAPVWVCPFHTFQDRWPLTGLRTMEQYVNFGFWDVLQSAGGQGEINKRIEAEVLSLGGTKALYSTSYYTAEDFWSVYDQTQYNSLKSRVDPRGVWPDLFSTVVSGR